MKLGSWKKLLVAVLATVTSLTLLVGCGGDGSKTSEKKILNTCTFSQAMHISIISVHIFAHMLGRLRATFSATTFAAQSV